MEDLKIYWFAVTWVCFFREHPVGQKKCWNGKDSINPYFHKGKPNLSRHIKLSPTIIALSLQ